MAEQWPFKPLVESSSLSALTELLAAYGGFLLDRGRGRTKTGWRNSLQLLIDQLGSCLEIHGQLQDQSVYPPRHVYKQLPFPWARLAGMGDLKSTHHRHL